MPFKNGVLNFEIGGLDCRAIKTEYISRVIENTWTTYFVMHWSM